LFRGVDDDGGVEVGCSVSLNVSKFLYFMLKYNFERGLIRTSLVDTFFKDDS